MSKDKKAAQKSFKTRSGKKIIHCSECVYNVMSPNSPDKPEICNEDGDRDYCEKGELLPFLTFI